MSSPIGLLKEQIKKNRPTISNASLLTYSSLLRSMYMSHNESVDDMNVEWFKNPVHIIQALEDKPHHTRKTAIASLMALIGKEGVDKRIIDMMVADKNSIKQKYTSQEMSDKQKENWMSMDEIKQIESRLFDMVKPILSQKHSLSPEQHVMLTNWLLVALTSGIYFPPRRSSDWAYIKLKEYNPETDNYINLKKGVFVLNRYKTAKIYGREEISYGKPFATLLKKAIARLDGQTYLLENKGKSFSASLITARLNKLFGKNVSTSMLRHIWTSDKYKNMPKLKELTENAKAMSHSVEKHLEYILHA